MIPSRVQGALAIGLVALATSSAAAQSVSFATDIRPIFESSCWKCHGGSVQLSKLDLRTRDAALRGGEHGAAIVPGKAEESRLYRLVAALEKPSMPLDGKLSADQIATIRRWIDQGAAWDRTSGGNTAPDATAALEEMAIPPEARRYWAFQKPVRPPVPASVDLTNPVDRFLEQSRAEKGLHRAQRADRVTLLRRAYLDLIGLPPTPAETAEYLADESPNAWANLIEKLLASPHYGERWGRHWLDVARYADSNGYEHDYDRPNAWRYRDYVIRAFNQDTPYNIFLAEQIAGDELDWVTNDSLIATGFLRCYAKVGCREKDNPQFRFEYLDDMIATLGRGVLGLTVQCARCHNHKFDPIAQKDYYNSSAGGARVYAARFDSTQGAHDGLYWPSNDNSSPLGPMSLAPATTAPIACRCTATSSAFSPRRAPPCPVAPRATSPTEN